jgi:predicted membrane-bound spermidine synthase
VALFRPPCINLIIAFLVFAGGLIGGMHFPLSIAALKKQRAGFVYGIDLVGSSVGALVTAMVLIPMLGIVQTLLVFVFFNFLVGMGLATIHPRYE